MRVSPTDVSEDSLQAIEALEERLRRYPAERYPIQHATACFHLGLALTTAGRLPEAAASLEQAAALFEQRLLPEHAKSLNALGAVFRMQARHPEAANAFQRAADEFQLADLAREYGAAVYNLGLVQRDMGDVAAATETFRRAATIFEEKDGQARAAATRELGVTLLGEGKFEAAAEALTEAMALAERAGDQRGLGAATNTLGVALLAASRPQPAIEAFRRSAAANPRPVRAAEYAMAKANLALAYAEFNDPERAHLAAGQALAVAQASEAVRSQAADILRRLGANPAALLNVLRDEPLEAWAGILREEFMRWCDLEAEELAHELAAWISGQVADAREADLAEAWVGALLELRPEEMERIIRALLDVLARQAPTIRDPFRAQLATAMARFHAPQWERLKSIMNRVATELGQEPSW
jgi:tetratricopeptide (TPR) repeat protein